MVWNKCKRSASGCHLPLGIDTRSMDGFLNRTLLMRCFFHTRYQPAGWCVDNPMPHARKSLSAAGAKSVSSGVGDDLAAENVRGVPLHAEKPEEILPQMICLNPTH